MEWITIAVVIIVVLIIAAFYRRAQWNRRYESSIFGYFVNQQHAGAIFPQTGEPLTLTLIAGRYCASAVDDKTGTLAPRAFAEFGGRYIVIPELNSALADVIPSNTRATRIQRASLTLFATETPDADIVPTGAGATLRLVATIDDETKMPTIILGEAASANAVWEFNSVEVTARTRARKLFGYSNAAFAEMPDKFPSWAEAHPEFARALAAGEFRATLKNHKYPELQYPNEFVRMKRWGRVGIILVPSAGSAAELSDPQILLAPTSTEMVFRAFSMRPSAINRETGRVEGYTQLVATNGAATEFSKMIIDTDAARWKLVLA